jgi:AraC-like DNA-binding protein
MLAVPTWRLPLGGLPEITMIGIGLHRPGEPARWRLADRWCLHLYRYHAALTVDGHALPVQPGFVGLTPPDTDIHYTFQGPSLHAYAHFRLPEVEPVIAVPAMHDLGTGFAAAYASISDAIGWHATQPRRAEARLYDLLWGLTGHEPARGHPALERARHHIELCLAEPLDVAGIARVAGCSPPHLLRLFRRELATTVVGYIRARRVARAAAMLRATTMPIAMVAREVGIADLHAFNKAVKRELGLPPRAVRAGGR